MKQSIFKGKTVIVTGGTGSIGSEIVRQLLKTNLKQLRVYSRDEHKQNELRHELGTDARIRYLIGDVRDKERLDLAFEDVDICFHTAALKHVPICEYNPFEATKTNIIGTQNVIDVSLKHDLDRVIAISTDKAVNPTSVLGASKLMMEKLVTAANSYHGRKRTRFATVRFGNVLSSRGSVLPIWLKQIEKGESLTVTDKRATRFFMEIPEAVGLVFSAMEHMQGGEIFVLKMGRKFKIAEFAEEILKKHAGDKNIGIMYIGLRPGEKLHEELMTDGEAAHALDLKGMFVIPRQNFPTDQTRPRKKYRGAKKVTGGAYRSDQ